MSARDVPELVRQVLSASISEPWELDGTLVRRPKKDRAAHLSPFIVDCSGTGDAPAVQAARAAICAAAPAAVRLVLLLEQYAVTMQLGDWLFHLINDAGGRFSPESIGQFNELHSQVRAALEGRS